MDIEQILNMISGPNIFSTKELKTNGIALLIYSLTKTFPRVIKYSDYNEIVLNEKQIAASRQYLSELINSEPGPVRIVGTAQVILPEIIKKYWPYAAGTLIAGYVLGKIF